MPAVTIPILPSSNFDTTAAFYSALGFVERGRWPDEYLIVGHPDLDVELHFWPNAAVDRWTNDVACYVRFATVGECLDCHRGWSGVDIADPAVLSEVDTGPAGDGSVEFHVIDLDGNLVRFGGFAE